MAGITNSTIEDLEGDLTVKPPPEVDPTGRYEAQCHICPWTWFASDDFNARAFLRAHIIDAHLRPGAYDPYSVETGQDMTRWAKKTSR